MTTAEIPQTLVASFAFDGIMLIPVADANQERGVIEKTKKGVTEKRATQVRFVSLTGKPSR